MEEGLRSFWLCFVPLFVAVDAIGVLPMFMSLTEGLELRACSASFIHGRLSG